MKLTVLLTGNLIMPHDNNNYYQRMLFYRGDDFRVAFKKLGSLRALTPVPFMALTATASPHSKSVIIESLHLNSPVVVAGNINRPNIFLSASPISRISASIIIL